MRRSPDVSIVIGSYNNKNLTVNLIKSIYKYTKNVDFEIIVIDDCSPDRVYDSITENFPQIITYKNSRNLGYTKTYNKGTKLSKGKYILHLNADTLFTKNTNLKELITYMDLNREVGILGNRAFLHHNGKPDPNSKRQLPTLKSALGQSLGLHRFFPKSKSLNYYMTYLSDDEPAEVGSVGAFMLFRRELLKNVGYFDEDFVIGSDVDFYYRTIRKGWKIIYYPDSTIIHYGGQSVSRFNIKNQIDFHKDLWKYYKKNLIKEYSAIIKYIIALGLIFRFFVFMVVEFFISIDKKRNNS